MIDFGATDHMTRRRDWFSIYEEFAEPLRISRCNGSFTLAYGRGNVDFERKEFENCFMRVFVGLWK